MHTIVIRLLTVSFRKLTLKHLRGGRLRSSLLNLTTNDFHRYDIILSTVTEVNGRSLMTVSSSNLSFTLILVINVLQGEL